MSIHASKLSDKRGVIHSFPWITPLLLGISRITLQNLSLHFRPLYHLQPCKFFSFFLLQCITDRMHQIRIHRYRNILKRIRPLLCLLDIRRQTIGRVLHLRQLDRKLLHFPESFPCDIHRLMCRAERIRQIILLRIVLDMRDLGSHDASGLHLQRILDRYGKCQFLDFTDPVFDIGTLQAGICFCKCCIDLFLNVFRLIDQTHQFFQKNIPLFIHQIITLACKHQRILREHQISFGRKFSRIHMHPSFTQQILSDTFYSFPSVFNISFVSFQYFSTSFVSIRSSSSFGRSPSSSQPRSSVSIIVRFSVGPCPI